MKNYDNILDKIEKCLNDAADELSDMGFGRVPSVRDAIKKVISLKL